MAFSVLKGYSIFKKMGGNDSVRKESGNEQKVERRERERIRKEGRKRKIKMISLF